MVKINRRDKTMTDQDNINLKEYINSKIIDMEKLFETRITSLEKATIVAANLMEKRLESMNEFRQQLKDQSNTFITRNEHGIQHEKVVDDIRSLRESRSCFEGKASQADVNKIRTVAIIGVIIAVISAVFGIVTTLIEIYK